MSTEIVREQLIQAAKQGNFPFDSKQFADYMDANDELSKYKAEFAIPLRRNVSGENPIAGKLFWLRARARARSKAHWTEYANTLPQSRTQNWTKTARIFAATH